MLRSAVRTIPRSSQSFRTTTILAVRKGEDVVLMGDKLVTTGSVSVKHTALKIRVISKKDQADVLVGFAGSVADAFSLLQRLEGKLDEYPGQLLRACVELAKAWRSDKYLRRLEASIVACDPEGMYTVDGMGNVLQDDGGVIGIGSGGYFATAAAMALIDVEGFTAEQICAKAMKIATSMDINSNGAHDMLKVSKSNPTAVKS